MFKRIAIAAAAAGLVLTLAPTNADAFTRQAGRTGGIIVGTVQAPTWGGTPVAKPCRSIMNHRGHKHVQTCRAQGSPARVR